jgi:hypothetical protein
MAIHSVTSGEKAQVEGSLLTRGPGVPLVPSWTICCSAGWIIILARRVGQRKSPAWSAAHSAKVRGAAGDLLNDDRCRGRAAVTCLPCPHDGVRSGGGRARSQFLAGMPGGDHAEADFPADGVADVPDLLAQGQRLRAVDGIGLAAVGVPGQGGDGERGDVLFMDGGGLRVRPRQPDGAGPADRFRPPPPGLAANIPGRMNVQSIPDCSMASSTPRFRRAIGLCSAPVLTTAADDSRTTCRVPAARAASTNPWMPAGLA